MRGRFEMGRSGRENLYIEGWQYLPIFIYHPSLLLSFLTLHSQAGVDIGVYDKNTTSGNGYFRCDSFPLGVFGDFPVPTPFPLRSHSK
jgi:hypothetical protein